MSLFRGAEYSQLMLATKREPLTFYDMNLSAQDHQTFFTCETDTGKEDMESMFVWIVSINCFLLTFLILF